MATSNKSSNNQKVCVFLSMQIKTIITSALFIQPPEMKSSVYF